jgi:hypothetical protein
MRRKNIKLVSETYFYINSSGTRDAFFLILNMKYYITFDTNIIHNQYGKPNHIIELVNNFFSKKEGVFLIPQIVLDEYSHQFKPFLSQQLKPLKESLKTLTTLESLSMEIDLQGCRENITRVVNELKGINNKNDRLVTQQITCKSETIPYSFCIQNISNRYFRGIKPFTKDGSGQISEIGMKDAILWQSLIEFFQLNKQTQQATLIFITNDKDLYQSTKSEDLDSNLKEEIEKLNVTCQVLNEDTFIKWVEEQGILSKLDPIDDVTYDSINELVQKEQDQIKFLIEEGEYQGSGCFDDSVLENFIKKYYREKDVDIETVEVNHIEIEDQDIFEVHVDSKKRYRLITIEFLFSVSTTILAYRDQIAQEFCDLTSWRNDHYLEGEKVLEVKAKIRRWDNDDQISYELISFEVVRVN